MAVAACTGRTQDEGPPFFSLEEWRSHPLPLGASIRAIAISPAGWMAIAPEGEVLTLVSPEGNKHPLRVKVNERLLGIRLGPCDSCASALMNEDTLLVEVDGYSGSPIASWNLRLLRGHRWTSAVPSTSDSWYAAADHQPSGWRVYSFVSNGHSSELADLSAYAGTVGLSDSTIVQSMRLTPAEDGVIAAMSGPPHQALVLSPAGKVVTVLRPSALAQSVGDGRVDSVWIGLGVFDIGNGYLQVLANPGSDDRVLVLFDRSGKELRSTFLHAPWGPAAVLADPPWLVALRNANPPEVVIYRWRWTEHANETLTP